MADDTTKATATLTVDEPENKRGAEAEGAGTQTVNTEAQSKFTQADLDRIAGDARKDERTKLERKAKDDDERRTREAAEKQGEFEKLYNDLKPQADTQAQELERYKATVKTLVEAELKALPEEVRAMLPNADSPLDLLDAVPRAKALAEKLTGAAALPGNGKSPKPAGTGDAAHDIRHLRAADTYRM